LDGGVSLVEFGLELHYGLLGFSDLLHERFSRGGVHSWSVIPVALEEVVASGASFFFGVGE
jgi:hypothetical protein